MKPISRIDLAVTDRMLYHSVTVYQVLARVLSMSGACLLSVAGVAAEVLFLFEKNMLLLGNFSCMYSRR